jgi:hypothetical protein
MAQRKPLLHPHQPSCQWHRQLVYAAWADTEGVHCSTAPLNVVYTVQPRGIVCCLLLTACVARETAYSAQTVVASSLPT